MKICIVGGDGFIGQWVVNELLLRGHSAVVIGRSDEPKFVMENVEYVSSNYEYQIKIRPVLERVDGLIHLASSTIPSTSVTDPSLDFTTNVLPSLTLFQEAAEVELSKLLFVSSGGTVYGDVEVLPIHENSATNPISSYGISKLAIERYADMFYRLKGLNTTVVRPANAYGVGRDGQLGRGFITQVICALVYGSPLHVFGDGSNVRDYVHVKDIARGIMTIFEDSSSDRVYNIGTGIGLSNTDIVREVEEIADVDQGTINVDFKTDRGFDVVSNILDASRLRSLSGWQPSINIKDGIRELLQAVSTGNS